MEFQRHIGYFQPLTEGRAAETEQVFTLLKCL